MLNVRGLPCVIPENMLSAGEESDEQTRACRKDSCCPLKKEIGMRRTLLLLLSMAVALLLASGAVVALPSEKPDDTPMIDGRVRAIEQVGTNIWIGGRFSRVERRNGTLLGNVANVAVFDSKMEQYRKGVAPTLGGTDAEVFDMTIYGEDVLIAGNFPGPTSNKSNLVLVDGDTGEVIRWYNAPKLKSVLAAPKLGRVYGGGVSLSAFDFATGEKLWTKAKTEADTVRAHDSKPAYRDLELDADGKTIWAACICDKVDGKAAKALVKLDLQGNHDASWLTQAGTGTFGLSVVDHDGKLYLAPGAATSWPSSTRGPGASSAGSKTPQARHRQWRSMTGSWWSAGTSTTSVTIKQIRVGPGARGSPSSTQTEIAKGGRA
jgi:hypothetical protein